MAFSLKLTLIVMWSVFNAGLSQNNPELNHLESFVDGQCKDNAGPGHYEELRTKSYELYKYYERAILLLPNYSELFCKRERQQLVSLADDVQLHLLFCLPRREQFLAGFFKNSFVEVLNFLCDNNAENTRRYFREGVECMETLEKSNSTHLADCFSRIFATSQGHITQQELCEDIAVAKRCFKQLIAMYCPMPNMRILNEDFFKYVSRPCAPPPTPRTSQSTIIGANTFALALTLLRSLFSILKS